MPKCKNCIHFLVCANVYCQVTADTEIKNINGKSCYYFCNKETSYTGFYKTNIEALGRVISESEVV